MNELIGKRIYEEDFGFGYIRDVTNDWVYIQLNADPWGIYKIPLADVAKILA